MEHGSDEGIVLMYPVHLEQRRVLQWRFDHKLSLQIAKKRKHKTLILSSEFASHSETTLLSWPNNSNTDGEPSIDIERKITHWLISRTSTVLRSNSSKYGKAARPSNAGCWPASSCVEDQRA